MSDLTRALILVAIQVVPLGVGWATKERGIARKAWARPLSRFVIYFFNTGVCFLAAWYLPRDFGALAVVRLVAISVLFGGCITVAGMLMGRLHRHSGRERGVYIIGSALSNYGFTLGGFICYIFFRERGLSLQTIYILPLVAYIYLVWFPIGRYYGDEVETVGPLASFVAAFSEITSLPLAGAFVGLALNRGLGVAPPDLPAWAGTALSWTTALLVYAGTITSMFCIGITLELGSVLKYRAENASICVTKFLVGPVIGYALATLLGASGIERQVVVILSCVPVGIFTSFAANLFGLNRDLANSLFVVNTAVFLVAVLPVLVWLLDSFA